MGHSSDDGSGEAMAEVRRTAAAIALDRLRAPLEAQELMALRETVVGMESLRSLGAMVASQGGKLREVCGSKSYCAPEVLEGRGYEGFPGIPAELGGRPWAPRTRD